MKRPIYSIILTLLLCVSCNNTQNDRSIVLLSQIPQQISLGDIAPKPSGRITLTKQPLTPNKDGVIADIELTLPDFKRGIYYRPFSEKLAAGNRMQPIWFNNVAELSEYKKIAPNEDAYTQYGAFVLLEQKDGQYVAIMPLVSNHVGNTFSVRDNNIYLTMATYGTQSEDVEVPLLSFAVSRSPYEACRQAWQVAMNCDEIKDNIGWRNDKKYPEAFEYFGWCTWEHFRNKITEDNVVEALKGINQSSIPFRWAMIDDGYLDHQTNKLKSFGVNSKFPNGWKPIMAQKSEKIKWMGVWCNFNGYMQGVALDHTMSNISEHLVSKGASEGVRMMPKISQESANAFYNEMTSTMKNEGFDLIKVDFQSNNFLYNTATSNAILGVHYNNKALEDHCVKNELGLLNCIAMHNFNVFNHSKSCVIRGSVDYKISTGRFDLMTIQNFMNTFWLGHNYWIDHDMFFANHEPTAEVMAIYRALSGGPIYLSDVADNIDDKVLKPLYYSDGHIIRPLAPGVPLPESLMQDPYYGGGAFRVIAPLDNGVAAIVALNVNQDEDCVTSYISADDYQYAGGMIQPYEGLWEMPKGGLLLYDYLKGTVEPFTSDYEFTIEMRKYAFVQLIPRAENITVIGLADKYLPAPTYKTIGADEKSVTISLEEDGDILVWTDNKTPTSESFKFTKVNGGLWRGTLTNPKTNREYTLTTQM